MPRLIAIRELKYNTRRLLPGEEFDASDKDTKILIGIKKAKVAPPPPPPRAVARPVAPRRLERPSQVEDAPKVAPADDLRSSLHPYVEPPKTEGVSEPVAPKPETPRLRRPASEYLKPPATDETV